MKICFPVEHDNGIDSEIYGHFGSAPGFVTYDTETKATGYINNRNAQHEHGACNPAQALGNSGVSAIVVAGIGQGAIMRLVSDGVDVYQAKTGMVKDDINLFTQNMLTKLNKNMSLCGGGSHSCGH